jgi:OPA family glycerol-3-phosphate transporter-like MFS transporter
MISLGLLMTGAADLLIGTLPAFVLILLLWCVNAYAQSMLWSSLLRCMTGLYGKETADRKVPILVSSVSVGNIAGIVISTWVVETIGIRAAFLVPGGLTLLLGIATALVLRTVPEGPKPEKAKFPIAEFFRDKKIRGMLLPALFHGVVKDNIGSWMAIYFVTRYAIDLEKSALFVLLIPAVGMVGRLVYPLCYRLSGRRENLISVLCFAVCAMLAGVLCLNPGAPLVAAICLSLIYALISMINTSTLSMFPLHFAEKNMVSSVSGVADFFTYFGAGIGSAVYGFWNKGGNFVPMFASWVVLCAVSILLLCLQHPLRRRENETSVARS